MGDMTIKQLALMLGTPVDVLVPQLTEAGVVFEGISDTIDREGKLKLLDYLRQRFARQKEPRKAEAAQGRGSTGAGAKARCAGWR